MDAHGEWRDLDPVWHSVAGVAASWRAGPGLADWYLRHPLRRDPSRSGFHRRASQESHGRLTERQLPAISKGETPGERTLRLERLLRQHCEVKSPTGGEV